MLNITFTPDFLTLEDHSDVSELITLIDFNLRKQSNTDSDNALTSELQTLTIDKLYLRLPIALTASLQHALDACRFVEIWETISSSDLAIALRETNFSSDEKYALLEIFKNEGFGGAEDDLTDDQSIVDFCESRREWLAERLERSAAR